MNLIGEKIQSELLKELVHDMHQGINTVTEKVEYLNEGIPIIQSKHITKGYLHFNDAKFLSSEAYDKYQLKYQPKVDDLLVCNIGTIGKSLRVSEENQFLIAWNLFLIKIKKDQLHSSFFAHYLNYLADHNYFDRFLTGGTVKFINKKTMGNIPVPLPPLDQQKKIAAILDTADGCRQKTKALISKYDELTQSLFLDMFGDPVTNIKGWETKPLSDFIKSLNTGVSVNSTDKKFKEGEIGILKTSCVYTGIFRAEEAKVIRKDEYGRMKLNPTADSIIISRMNTSELVGKSAYISKDYKDLYLPDRLWQSEKGELNHNVRWLSHAVSFQSFMNEISKISSGTSGSMKNISKKNYLNLHMIYPTLELQNQFAERVEAIEVQKAQTQKSLDKAEDLFNSLLQKAFKGELI